MAKTPWEMAAVGREFSHQTALFAWAAFAVSYGLTAANDPKCYNVPGHLANTYGTWPSASPRAKFEPYAKDLLPELKWLHAIKNQGHGDAIRGSRSAAEGVRSGVFDVFLPVSCECRENLGLYCGNGHSIYAGLYLELKKEGGRPSDAQLEFQADMRAQGYAAEIVVGWEAARDCLLTYLGKSGAS